MKNARNKFIIPLILVMFFLFAINSFHTYVGMEGLAFWGYPYVSSFGGDVDKVVDLRSYRCPLFIAPDEIKQVGITVVNKTNKTQTVYVQIVISQPTADHGAVQEEEKVILQSGESQKIAWKINSQNIVNQMYILSRSFVGSQPLFVSQKTVSCHPIVLNVAGVPSSVIGIGFLILPSVAMIVLAVLYNQNDPVAKHHKKPRSSLIYLVLCSMIMTFGSFIGSWLIGLLMIIFILLGLLAFMQTDSMKNQMDSHPSGF